MQKLLEKWFGPSYRIAAAGFLGGLVLIFGEICDAAGVQLQNSHITNGTFEISNIVAGLGMLGIGWFGRDNAVTSGMVNAAGEGLKS